MRPNRDQWAMEMAVSTAKRATCLRRSVGAVLLNSYGHVVSTGYNGVASGQPHCNHHDRFHPTAHPYACPGAHSASGTNLDGCHAIHAEQNALLQCRDVYTIDSCYVTTSPCMTCAKLLLNTSCKRIIFLTSYPGFKSVEELWKSAGRSWEKYVEPIDRAWGTKTVV